MLSWIEARIAVTLFCYKPSCFSYVNDHVHGLVSLRIPRFAMKSRKICNRKVGGGGGGGGGREVLELLFTGYVPLASKSPYPIWSILWPIIDPILVTFGQICNFRDPNLVTFYLCVYLIDPLNRSS